jgi:hypothetical protein
VGGERGKKGGGEEVVQQYLKIYNSTATLMVNNPVQKGGGESLWGVYRQGRGRCD